jgi:hypothetical protein
MPQFPVTSVEGHHQTRHPCLRLGNLLHTARLTLAKPASPLQPQVQSRRMTHSNVPASNALFWQTRSNPTSNHNCTVHTETSNDAWGVPPGPKLEDTLRIGFQNLGGFPEFPSHFKNASFCNFMVQHEFDIFGLAETNLKWCILPAEAQFHECVRDTWSNKTHATLA